MLEQNALLHIQTSEPNLHVTLLLFRAIHRLNLHLEHTHPGEQVRHRRDPVILISKYFKENKLI